MRDGRAYGAHIPAPLQLTVLGHEVCMMQSPGLTQPQLAPCAAAGTAIMATMGTAAAPMPIALIKSRRSRFTGGAICSCSRSQRDSMSSARHTDSSGTWESGIWSCSFAERPATPELPSQARQTAAANFCRQPCGFSGGTLRIYPLTGAGHIDIAPVHNSLLVFPSFVQHEVMPVACPSRHFMDSRFAVNCWFRKSPKTVT